MIFDTVVNEFNSKDSCSSCEVSVAVPTLPTTKPAAIFANLTAFVKLKPDELMSKFSTVNLNQKIEKQLFYA